jgi:predicted  nucleic acid-binding Zn-ribbon protein
MSAQLEMLIRLQELDTEVGKLEHKLAEVIPQVDAMRAHYREAELALEDGKAAVETAKKSRRQAERDLDAHIEKMRKFEEQQSKVKTNKEYQALMGEMEALRKEKAAAEDRILVEMEAQSEAEKKIAGLTAEVGREKGVFAEREKVLLAEAAKLKGEIERFEAQRAGILAEISPDNLRTYDRVRKFRGSAVAEVRDELCLGCRMTMPPQKFVEVMRNDSILTCPHCQRILFHKKLDPVPAAEGQ